MATQEQLDELRRIERVSDMLTSMHAMLRDHYALWAVFLDAVLILGSVTLGTFALADFTSLGAFSVDPDAARVVMAVASCIIFVASVVAYKVDWKAKADGHGRACSAYGRFKLRCRELLARADQLTEEDLRSVSRDYASLGEAHLAVPDAQFIALKATHEQKAFLSRCLSRRPFASARLLAFAMWWRHTCGALRDRAPHEAGSEKGTAGGGKNHS